MEIRVLRYFLAIANEGSITKAANLLHVTQPTLSRQIHDLEDELGQKLFIRGSHSMALTAEGMILKKRAGEILDMVDKTEAEFVSMGKEIEGDIYIGSWEADVIRLIAEIIKDIQKDYPKIHYHLYSGRSDDIMERLDKGLLDFGILGQPVDISKYDYVTMPSKNKYGLVMRKDSPLASKKYIKREDLLNIPIIDSPWGISRERTGNIVTEWFGEGFDKLNIVATYNLIYNAEAIAEAGIGYVITLDGIINTTTYDSLCFRPFEPMVGCEFSMIWKKNQMFSAAAGEFLERISERFS